MKIEQAISDMLCQIVNRDNYSDIKSLANRRLAPYRYGNGRVLSFDDCEHTNVFWDTSVAGAGAAAVSNTIAWDTEKSYKLSVGAADADVGSIIKTITQTSGYIGLDFYFSITDGDYNAFTEIFFRINNYKAPAIYQEGEIMLKTTGAATGMGMYYKDSTGSDILLNAAFPISASNDNLENFHHVKLVINTLDAEYYYLMYDNNFYDLRGKGLYTATSTQISRVKLSIGIQGKTVGGAATDMHVDQLAITDQEKLPKYPEEYLKAVEL